MVAKSEMLGISGYAWLIITFINMVGMVAQSVMLGISGYAMVDNNVYKYGRNGGTVCNVRNIGICNG